VRFGRYLRNQWDRVGAVLCVVGGAIALLMGWLGVSGTLETGKQLPYVVSGAMGGLFLLGAGRVLNAARAAFLNAPDVPWAPAASAASAAARA
jgi:hypothetical protein